jgi:hypothetical protein
MELALQPWQFLLLILAGWINSRQQEAIDYLMTEKRILLNDDQRRRLAIKGKILGRKMLNEPVTIVTPETILRWHRELVAWHWDHSRCRKSAWNAWSFSGRDHCMPPWSLFWSIITQSEITRG